MKSMSPKPECPPAVPGRELRIRPMTPGDFEPLHALLSRPDVMRYLEAPYTREQTSAFLRRACSEDPPVLAAEADGTFIGYVIFHPWDPASIEIGWVLFPEYWGRGYASALTEILIKKAFAEDKDVVIECVPQQEATRRIARKYGFTFQEMRDGLLLYRLTGRSDH